MSSASEVTQRPKSDWSGKKWLPLAGVWGGVTLAACAGVVLLSAANRRRDGTADREEAARMEAAEPKAELKDRYDFVVVGSGAGGGPLASNLARGGFSVLLLEAG